MDVSINQSVVGVQGVSAPLNSEFFFAKTVIIAESKNDAQVIDHILRLYDIDIVKNAISIINLEGIKNFRYPYYLLEYLKIPRILVVDKDFFTNYRNGKADNSKDSSGFPMYSGTLKLKKFMKKVTNKDPLVSDFENLLAQNNHTKILDFLENYNIVCMQYNLECDLVATSRGIQSFYNNLNIAPEKRKPTTLLVDNSEKIKEIDVLMNVIEGLSKSNLSRSYQRIAKVVGKYTSV